MSRGTPHASNETQHPPQSPAHARTKSRHRGEPCSVVTASEASSRSSSWECERARGGVPGSSSAPEDEGGPEAEASCACARASDAPTRRRRSGRARDPGGRGDPRGGEARAREGASARASIEDGEASPGASARRAAGGPREGRVNEAEPTGGIQEAPRDGRRDGAQTYVVATNTERSKITDTVPSVKSNAPSRHVFIFDAR